MTTSFTRALIYIRSIIVFVSFTLGFANAEADLGIRAQSFGGAYRAVAHSNDTIYYNPAGLLKNRRMGSDVDYKVSSFERLHNLSVSVIDGTTSSWALGLAYNAGIYSKNERNTTHTAYLGMAMPLGTDMFAIGSSIYYRYDNEEKHSPYRHFFNMDAGIMAMLPIGLDLALVIDHFLKPKGLEKSLGLSVAAAFDLGRVVKAVPLTLAFDWLMDDVMSHGNLNHIINVGAQFVLFDILPLRIGIKAPLKEHQQLISLGGGIMVKNFAVDGLYQQHLSVGKIRHFGLAVRLEL